MWISINIYIFFNATSQSFPWTFLQGEHANCAQTGPSQMVLSNIQQTKPFHCFLVVKISHLNVKIYKICKVGKSACGHKGFELCFSPCLSPCHLFSSCRDQEQVPLCRVGLVRRAPDPHASASHVSISGTCSSVWRTRDLPVAPIFSTRAFSNRLDVREERERGEVRGGKMTSVWRDQRLLPQRAWETLRNEEEKSSNLAHFKFFPDVLGNLKYNSSHICWSLYLPLPKTPIFFQRSPGLVPLYLTCRIYFWRRCKKRIILRVFVWTNDLYYYALQHSTVYFLIICMYIRL